MVADSLLLELSLVAWVPQELELPGRPFEPNDSLLFTFLLLCHCFRDQWNYVFRFSILL